jgi:hypothetical protein
MARGYGGSGSEKPMVTAAVVTTAAATAAAATAIATAKRTGEIHIR